MLINIVKILFPFLAVQLDFFSLLEFNYSPLIFYFYEKDLLFLMPFNYIWHKCTYECSDRSWDCKSNTSMDF